MKERFATIRGAGCYVVSDLGRVARVDAQVRKHFLKGTLNSEGYLLVTLYDNGKRQQRAIHRLVAEAFIPNPDNLPDVNHLKGIKIDNRATELEWCTRAHNNAHALATGLRVQYRGGKDNAKKKVINSTTGEVFNSIKDAAESCGIKYYDLRAMLCGIKENTTNISYQ